MGAWNARIGLPPTPRLCHPWRKWMKRSDPAVYKTFLVLFITFLNVVTSVLRKVKRKVRVAVGGDWTRSELQASVGGGGAVRDATTGPGQNSRLQLAVAVLFVMLVGVFSIVLSLLIIAGDVELNPGPPKGRN